MPSDGGGLFFSQRHALNPLFRLYCSSGCLCLSHLQTFCLAQKPPDGKMPGYGSNLTLSKNQGSQRVPSHSTSSCRSCSCRPARDGDNITCCLQVAAQLIRTGPVN